jgi:hypothetical protein
MPVGLLLSSLLFAVSRLRITGAELPLPTHFLKTRMGTLFYGLDGAGIETRWGARFSAPVRAGPGAHPASSTMGTGFLAGAWRSPPTPSSAEVEGRVELYICSPLWAFVACFVRCNLTFPLPSSLSSVLSAWGRRFCRCVRMAEPQETAPGWWLGIF